MNRGLWQGIIVLCDALLVNLVVVAAFLLRFGTDIPASNFAAYSEIALPYTLLQLSLFYVYDLYSPEELEQSADKSYRIITAVTIGTLIAVTLSFFLRQFTFPRSVLFYTWGLNMFSMLLWRYKGVALLPLHWPEKRVLVVGGGAQAERIVSELLRRSKLGYLPVGMVGGAEDSERSGVLPILGKIGELAEIISDNKINYVILATPARHREILENLAQTEHSDIQVEVIPDLYEIYIGRPDHTVLADIPLISLKRRMSRTWVKLVKRLMDLILGIFLLLFTSPFMVLAAIAIKSTSPGPVIFTQSRVGKERRVFKVYKFRTMYNNAEAATGPILAGKSDQRVTSAGRFLRGYRLDELPQLFNVIKGEMSLVGPRPERPEFVAGFVKEVPGYAERFLVRPGITGLAQVSGHYATTADTKLKYDLIYIYHQSILLDLRIMMRTVLTVLRGEGSH